MASSQEHAKQQQYQVEYVIEPFEYQGPGKVGGPEQSSAPVLPQTSQQHPAQQQAQQTSTPPVQQAAMYSSAGPPPATQYPSYTPAPYPIYPLAQYPYAQPMPYPQPPVYPMYSYPAQYPQQAWPQPTYAPPPGPHVQQQHVGNSIFGPSYTITTVTWPSPRPPY